MSAVRRGLMLTVHDGCGETLPYLFRMQDLQRCDEVLGWLCRNNITGKVFLSWMRLEQGDSILKASSYILMKLNRDKEARPLFAGKDWKP